MECMKQNRVEQAVIFAGGLGERLKPFTLTNPKPMYPFNDKPFIEYLVEQIKEFGITDIVILLGYLPEKVMDYLGDGSKYGVSIRYCVTPVEYDTQYRLKEAKDLLKDQFLMMYCDNYCPINFDKLVEDYYRNGAWIQFSAYSNEDGYTKNNLQIGEQGIVKLYDKARKQPNLAGVDIGYAIVSKQVLALMSDANENFEAVVYPKLVDANKLYATVTHHRYYSVGSFERIELTKDFLSDKKYIFLDRDGTINERAPKAQYITKPESFVWLEGAKEAILALKQAGYFIIMISNQAGIARGAMTESNLEAIHAKMQKELKEIGAGIDAIYYCAHNWEDNCFCRKPKPGMFYMAQRDYSINLTKCVMFGDDDRDMEAAEAAGVRGIQISEDYPLGQAVKDYLSE